MSEQRINLIMMPIPVDKGMASTTRLRNFIKYLPRDNTRITNIVSGSESMEYDYMGVRIIRINSAQFSFRKKQKMLTSLLRLHKAEGEKNILFYYDVPGIIDAMVIRHAKKHLGYKVIFDVVEDYSTQKLNLGLRGNVRLIYSGLVQKRLRSLADGAIGISGYLMEFLRKYMNGKPVINLPVAFDPEAIVPSLRGDSDKELSVFYGGTYGEKDGMEFLIRGFELAAAKEPFLHMHLTGKGSQIDMEKFNRLLQDSPARDRIKSHGFVSYEAYCNLLGNADILCMTRRNSRFANAGFPYKLGEFLATGKPVIVSRIGEVSRYLGDKDCCFVAPESGDEIADALLRLRDRKLREQIGENGKEVAYTHFDARNVANDLYKFLLKI